MRTSVIILFFLLSGCGGRLYTHDRGDTVGLCLPIFGTSETLEVEQ